MRFAVMVGVLGTLFGCANTGGIVPGQSTEAQVEASMGPSAERRQMANGEAVRYYSRLPHGRQIYAARFGADGKLIAVEPRLTDENVKNVKVGVSRTEDVRDLLGPPFRIEHYALANRDVWMYPMTGLPYARELHVEFSASDKVVREVMFLDDQMNAPN